MPIAPVAAATALLAVQTFGIISRRTADFYDDLFYENGRRICSFAKYALQTLLIITIMKTLMATKNSDKIGIMCKKQICV